MAALSGRVAAAAAAAAAGNEAEGKGSRGIIIANEYSVLAGSAIGGGGLSVDVVTPAAGPVTIIAITRGNRRKRAPVAPAARGCLSRVSLYPRILPAT